MKTQNRIEKAIDIFLDAINEGKLAKGSCRMCAVGNLCRAVSSPWKSDLWSWLFFTNSRGQQIYPFGKYDKYIEEARELISRTDFTEDELAQIEYAFETNTKIHHQLYQSHTKEEIRKDQISGLRAVIKVMESFPENKEVERDFVEEFETKAKQIAL